MARKKQSLLNGALVLVIAMGITKVIGAIYKIPLTNVLGTIGRSYYSTAYNLFIPIYSIALGGLPVAISKLVAQYAALERYNDVKRVFKVAKRVFIITGIVGIAAILIIAYPYCMSINRMDAIYAMYMVAPSIFFCCLMSAYKGYYNGLRNMTPSAVCEVIEAAVKLIFGLALSKLVLVYASNQAAETGFVFGTAVSNEMEIIDAAAPYSAAAAIVGVTLGTVFATLYISLRLKIKGDGITKEEIALSPAPDSTKEIRSAIFRIAIPVVVSTLIFNITNLIDSWTLLYRLKTAVASDPEVIMNMFKSSIVDGGYENDTELWAGFLHGAYEIAVDFKKIIPTLTTVLGISAIPVLSEAWTLKNHENTKMSIESVIRMCLMIAFPAGFGMAVLGKPILTLLYGDLSSNDISAKVMVGYGVTVFIIAISQPITNMLQTIGKANVTVKSIAIGALFKIIVNFILIGIPQINIFGAIIGTACCYFVASAINLVVLLRTTRVKISFTKSIFKPFICSVLCAAVAYVVYEFLNPRLIEMDSLQLASRINGSTISAMIAIIAAVVVYVISLLVTKTILESDILMLPKGEKKAKLLNKIKVLG